MSSLGQFFGQPARVTQYTSGTGTFTPLDTARSWARITLVGGGGGGSLYGGASSGTSVIWTRLSSSSYSYQVGAGGSGGVANSQGAFTGGTTWFGSMFQNGGEGGSWSSSYPNNPSPADGLGKSGERGGYTRAYPSIIQAGGNSQYGVGGSFSSPTGYGAGGSGNYQDLSGVAGSGGLIIIEEFLQ